MQRPTAILLVLMGGGVVLWGATRGPSRACADARAQHRLAETICASTDGSGGHGGSSGYYHSGISGSAKPWQPAGGGRLRRHRPCRGGGKLSDAAPSARRRSDWREHARTLGFAFAEIAGEPYWDETACWEFTADEVDTLEAATGELERLARLAADDAVRHDRHDMLGIPQAVWPLVAESWRRMEPSLYGRMDLRWDGASPPKLLRTMPTHRPRCMKAPWSSGNG